MTNNKAPKARRFTQEELDKYFDTERLNYAFENSFDARATLVNSVRIEELVDEVSGLREDMSKMQETFARIASAMEEANAIKREENAPPKKAAGKLNNVGRK